MTSQPVEIFFSYSHLDEGLRNQLAAHLSLMKREGLIRDWHDRRIIAGRQWGKEIDERMRSAAIILLLVSPDFLNSDYCYDIEVKEAMRRSDAGEAVVIPVILRPCDWQGAPFGKLQALPKDARPVTRWEDRDEALLDVARGIRRAVEEPSDAREAASAPRHEGSRPPAQTLIPDPPIIGFVARRDEQGRDIVGRLREELAPGRKRPVTLSGPGGIGKTTLAAEAARSLLDSYGGRVAWSSADGRTEFALPALLDDIATQLGRPQMRTLAPEAKAEQVRSLLAGAPALVVLDNCETLAAEELRRIVEWLTRARCASLFTSRPRIAGTAFVPISAMSREEAAEFLDKLVGQTQGPQVFTPEARGRIYETAEANPFIMQWIVGQIDEAREPATVFKELAEGEGDAAERVFARSFNLPLLGDDGRDALLALSLFPTSASREALAATAGFKGEDSKKRLDAAVKNLHALWLVKGLDGYSRLAVEGLTRTLSEDRLSADPRAADFHSRFVNHFVNYALDRNSASPANYDALEAEKDNILKAAELAPTPDAALSVVVIAYVLALPTSGMLVVRGYWDEVVRLGEQAVGAARALSEEKYLGELACNLAVVYSFRGELEKARLLYEESLEINRRLGIQSGVAGVLHELGRLAHGRGDWEEARHLYGESLAIKKELGSQRDLATTLHQMGRLAQDEADLEEARRLYEESLEINREFNNEYAIAATTSQIGILLWQQGRHEESKAKHDESLALRRKLGDRLGIAIDLHQLGMLAEAGGETKEARRLYEESLEIDVSLGNREGAAITLHQLGRLAEADGHKAEAARLFREALAVFEALGSPYAKTARHSVKRVS